MYNLYHRIALYIPSISFVNALKNNNQCKNCGWQKFIFPSIKSQEGGVSYVATNEKNPPDRSK